MIHPEVHALEAAYALDAIEAAERAEFEAHLAECAECRETVDDFHESVAALSVLVATPPPPALRGELLAAIGQIRPDRPPVTRLSPPRRPRRPARWLVAAAAAGVLGVGGVTAWEIVSDDSSQVEPSVTDRVLQAADAQRISAELDEGGSLTLVWSRSHGRAVIVTHDLPPAPAGHVYQLWLQSPAGDMVDAGLLTMSGDGVVALTGDASGATGAGVTVEPDGGSPEPTTSPIALFAMDA